MFKKKLFIKFRNARCGRRSIFTKFIAVHEAILFVLAASFLSKPLGEHVDQSLRPWVRAGIFCVLQPSFCTSLAHLSSTTGRWRGISISDNAPSKSPGRPQWLLHACSACRNPTLLFRRLAALSLKTGGQQDNTLRSRKYSGIKATLVLGRSPP